MADQTDRTPEAAAGVSRRSLVGGVGVAALGVAALARPAAAQSVAWKQPGNNRHVLELQGKGELAAGNVRLDYFGHCALRLTSPAGLSLLFDPWRNDPSGYWGVWFPKDFPRLVVDVALSTHTHFDHDALDKIDATMVLDRLIGTWSFADVTITAIADKHACSAPGWYKWTDAIREFGQEPCPPDNPGHMDMVMYVVDTGGVRTLIWGDNRHDPPENVWRALGRIDVLTLPVDGSQHILSYEQANGIVERLKPRAVIPTHYLCHPTTITLSTLQPADEWVAGQRSRQVLTKGTLELAAAELARMDREFLYFKDNVATG
jgi:L-ascorbate metabolism protein UlaG (beta-lactamase superfamily)